MAQVPLFPRTTPAYPLATLPPPVAEPLPNYLLSEVLSGDPQTDRSFYELVGGEFVGMGRSLGTEPSDPYWQQSQGYPPFWGWCIFTGSAGYVRGEGPSDNVQVSNTSSDLAGPPTYSYPNALWLTATRRPASYLALAILLARIARNQAQSGGYFSDSQSGWLRQGVWTFRNGTPSASVPVHDTSLTVNDTVTRAPNIPNDALACAAIAQSYLTFLSTKAIGWSSAATIPAVAVTNSLITSYNGYVTAIANAYDLQVTALNQNPAVVDPVAFANATVLSIQALVLDLIADGTAIVNGLVAQATTIVNGLLNNTVYPAVTTALGIVDDQSDFATALITSVLGIVTTTVDGAVATALTEAGKVQAEIDRQKAAGEALVNQTIIDAQVAVANAIAAALAAAGTVTTLVGQQVGVVLELALAAIGIAQSQVADRPLFYGALTTPITITSTSDVVVIPVGGLVVTAD